MHPERFLSRLLRPLGMAALGFAVLFATGCAVLPEGLAGPPSQAIAASAETSLGRIAVKATPDPTLSGFRLLPGGDFALDTRLQLIRRAERSLDVQYYHVDNDATGRYFLRLLRDAAERGVRVRLLMDDLHTSGEDDLLLGLAATPNLELRLFNPFPAGRSSLLRRFAASLLNFDRVQRRMHNKLFIADGAFAVAGGRNIGDAYFAPTGGAGFVDLDAVVAGALLPRLAQLFDLYWNSEYVVPVQAIVRTDASPAERRAGFEQATAAAGTPPPPPTAPNDVLGYAPLATELDAGRVGLVWARAEAHADAPHRVVGKTASYGGVPLLDVDSVRYNVREQIRRARAEVSITSPYFIPGEGGLEVIREVHGRGVSLSVVTNSLAATDEPLVHTAYRRYRHALLELGVELHELSPTRAGASVRLGLLGTQVGRLHAKAAVIDRRLLYLGSMNFDPRSDVLNTELGLFVDSPELARQVLKLIEVLKVQGSYRLRRVEATGGLEWVSGGPGEEEVHRVEPDTGLGIRLLLRLLAPLVPESFL